MMHDASVIVRLAMLVLEFGFEMLKASRHIEISETRIVYARMPMARLLCQAPLLL